MDNNNQTQSQTPQQPPVQPGVPTGTSYQMPPKKKLSKGALWGIIGGAIAFILIIVAVVLAVIFLGGPSKADYAEARTQMNEVRSKYNSLSLKSRSSSRQLSYRNSSSTADNDLKDALDEYKKAVADLENLKALKDKEVKEKYDAYIKQNEIFVAWIDGIIGSSDTLKKAGESCSSSAANQVLRSDFSNIGNAYRSAIGPCKDDLKELSKSKNTVLAAYGKKLLSVYEEQQKMIEDLQAAYIAKDQSEFNRISGEIGKQASEFSGISAEFSKSLSDKAEDAEVKDELNDLGKLVTDKANA